MMLIRNSATCLDQISFRDVFPALTSPPSGSAAASLEAKPKRLSAPSHLVSLLSAFKLFSLPREEERRRDALNEAPSGSVRRRANQNIGLLKP